MDEVSGAERLSLLAQVGQAMYGPLWQSAIANDIGVAPRTVRRWINEAEVPEKALQRLPEAIRLEAKRRRDQALTLLALAARVERSL